MYSICGLVLLSSCVLSSPLPHSGINYYQPNSPFLEKDLYDYPIFEPANSKPISQGFYYAQVQPQLQNHGIPQEHPFIHFSQQRPYQFPQQYHHPVMALNYGQSANIPNQIHPGGNRIQEIQPHHQDLYSSDVGTILSQFVNGFRDQVQQQGSIGPQQQQSFSAIQITPNGNPEALKEITAIVYNTETGSVKEIPALIYSSVSATATSQSGSGSLVTNYPQNVGGVELEDSVAPANREPCQKGPENAENPVQQNTESAEDFVAAENASPEPTPGLEVDYNKSKPENAPSQEEINKKYPVTILTPDAAVSVSTDNSNSNSSTDREVPGQATETSEFSPETSTVSPPDVVDNTGSSSLGDDVSGSITSSTTGPPPEWDVLTENLKAIEGETTVSDVESPAPK